MITIPIPREFNVLHKDGLISIRDIQGDEAHVTDVVLFYRDDIHRWVLREWSPRAWWVDPGTHGTILHADGSTTEVIAVGEVNGIPITPPLWLEEVPEKLYVTHNPTRGVYEVSFVSGDRELTPDVMKALGARVVAVEEDGTMVLSDGHYVV